MCVDNAGADVVLVAGDMGGSHIVPVSLRILATEVFPDQQIVYVPGNHDFYGTEIGKMEARLKKELADCQNLHILMGSTVEIQGKHFVGTTLWSDFFRTEGPLKHLNSKLASFDAINDFGLISYGDRKITPGTLVSLFDMAVGFLNKEIRPDESIVVTHNAPSFKSIAKRFAGDPISGCFVSNLEPLILNKRPKLWVHGHTHDNFDYFVGPTRVICNPHGYRNENKEYKRALTIEL